MIERTKALTLTAVLVFLSSALSFYAGAAGLIPQFSYPFARTQPRAAEPAPAVASGIDTKRLQRVQQYIQQQFVDQVSAQTLTEGALKGMVQATGDKYSTYYNAQEFKRFLEHFESTFSGIGVHVELDAKTGLVTVVSPIKGSPGERAGIRAGDAIISVDGRDIRGMELDQAVQFIRGPKGTKVSLQIQREGVADPLVFEVTRATIDVPAIESKMIEPGVGYIQLREFNKQIGLRTTRALVDLKAQGMERLILDLRQNPGGLLEEAISVSSLFVPPKQPVVHIVERGAEKVTHPSRAKDTWNLPMVVLIDGGSASASEILAGAIKDLKIGVLMGDKTFGKGSVQSFYELPEGGGLKLTTAKYLTAGGSSIDKVGIEPDIQVENKNKVLPGDPGDIQLQEALRYVKTMKR